MLAKNLTASDIIQIAGIVTSLFVSIISIVIAVLTLRQNNKMLEETTRPYISMSYDVLHNGNRAIFLILRNYGATGAMITSFNYSPRAKSRSINEKLDKIQGAFIAPGQKFIYPITPDHFPSDVLHFHIQYRTPFKEYTDDQELKIKIGVYKVRSTDDEAISYSIQEITERLI